MTDFCIQIHPDRSNNLDLARVCTICESLARGNKTLIKRFAFADRPADEEDVHHVNLIFDTDSPVDLWRLLKSLLYDSEPLGRPMQMSSMAMCEGEHGWRDYLLLYHYDPHETLCRFENH